MVTIHRCEGYEESQIGPAFDAMIRDIGGFEPYIQKGETVLLKVNLIAARGPEQAATVHPEFVKALSKALVDYGCTVIIGDSPGGTFNASVLKHVYAATGMDRVAQETGASLSMDTEETDITFPQGKILKALTVTHMSRTPDKIISVCKLKTHGMMTYTGAVKNMFGTIPGLVKPTYHVRMPVITDFAEALVDICEASRPVLSFMDAVIGMEGNGPTNGSPRKVGCVLASPSPYDLDEVAASLIGLSAADVPTLAAARSRGLSSGSPEILGDEVSSFIVSDYKLPDHIRKDLTKDSSVVSFFIRHVKPKVTFDYTKCVGCGRCAASCPAKTIEMRDHHPHCNHANCIHCYCCQELCPQNAVKIKTPWIYRMMNKM